MESLRGWYSSLRRLVGEARYRRNVRQWLHSFARTHTTIHPSVSFTGVPYPFRFVDIADKCNVEQDVTFWLSPYSGADPKLRIGRQVFIGRNTYIGVHQPITIGNHALIGAYCYIISGTHSFATRERPISDQEFIGKRIDIGADVWLGTHVVVLHGVTIGTGSVVAAGSLVNRDIPEYEVWGGMPAKFLKRRPD